MSFGEEGSDRTNFLYRLSWPFSESTVHFLKVSLKQLENKKKIFQGHFEGYTRLYSVLYSSWVLLQFLVSGTELTAAQIPFQQKESLQLYNCTIPTDPPI